MKTYFFFLRKKMKTYLTYLFFEGTLLFLFIGLIPWLRGGRREETEKGERKKNTTRQEKL